MALAAEHGICRIARTIRIDYAALKKRLEKMPKQKAPGDPTPQSFIELKSPAFITANPGEAAIEFSDDNGATMSCRLSGRVELDVIALAHAFWNKA